MQPSRPDQGRFVWFQNWFRIFIRDDWARVITRVHDVKLGLVKIGALLLP